jgi:hypothetical protein
MQTHESRHQPFRLCSARGDCFSISLRSSQCKPPSPMSIVALEVEQRPSLVQAARVVDPVQHPERRNPPGNHKLAATESIGRLTQNLKCQNFPQHRFRSGVRRADDRMAGSAREKSKAVERRRRKATGPDVNDEGQPGCLKHHHRPAGTGVTGIRKPARSHHQKHER